MKNYLYIDRDDDAHQARFKVPDTPKIDFLINEKRFDEALVEIDKLLKGSEDYINLNLKGVILDNLGRYEDAVDCFDKALILYDSSEIQLNKAKSLYDWAKITFFPKCENEKALQLIDKAIDALPSSVDSSEYYFLKAEILEGLDELVESHRNYLIAHKEWDRLDEFEGQIHYIENTDDILFIITGCSFYNFTPEPGMTVSLIKEEDNEYDPDAIAVTFEDKIIGYVANSSYTLINNVKSASELKKFINNNVNGRILFNHLGEYTVSKLIFSKI